ncbi:MAG: 4,5-DOPA dioxygenase extradiol [bacterium]|nr:4,5-DOPA dioxygenase extradiol [bacterium]
MPNRMPVLFLGHGNPMYAITENRFRSAWQKISQRLPRPQAILCISAHWETVGTYVTTMANPRTIHDFFGFPPALFDVEYPAPGSPELAQQICNIVTRTDVKLDNQDWGFDHGAWSILSNMYPTADIPVLQLSLDHTQPPEWHYRIGKQLACLREEKVLIIASGNIVHYLSTANLRQKDGFEWAIHTNDFLTECVVNRDFGKLCNYEKCGANVHRAIPTPEHYLPLLYTVGCYEEEEPITVFHNEVVNGSIAMTSFQFG